MLEEKFLLNNVEREKTIADEVKAFLSCMETVKDNFAKFFWYSYIKTNYI